MAEYVTHPDSGPTLKLRGCISNYKKTRESASFFFTSGDQAKIGAMAVLSAASGLAGQAAIMANYATSLEEEADFIEFDLDGKSLSGWVWRSPFQEGDIVEVAAQKRDDHYELFAVARPSDRVIALYPHCSRGRATHVRNAAKWVGYLAIYFFFAGILLGWLIGAGPLGIWGDFYFNFPQGFLIIGAGWLASALIVGHLARKWMPFVRLAERVFRILELPSPSKIDLKKSSKLHKTENDPPECGVMYFKY
ncbi:putative type VI secretion system effector [Herbaspirillum sp. C7C8]|jgi:hypothetical protein|uniref:putative type VI secretion system effector n=1 Tax=Herbaspirillum sp. C7C8 TaxID=2736665 RepID=UPI001F51CD63|nr:putative type VI secretion system effector [Herbaspirillum sp. C7C8]MCI1005928.1 hypothetical protein [Herbaspirillum sp. C7C8]